MRCPKCNILLEKRDSGCQFIRCFYCKMDICYLTKQPRWGPNVSVFERTIVAFFSPLVSDIHSRSLFEC